jgi:3D (Asp-Asp-Asp) domain-containing protein
MAGKGGRNMYLLPINTYFDYLRASKKWTVYSGGTVLLSFILGSSQNEEIRMPQLSMQQVKTQVVIPKNLPNPNNQVKAVASAGLDKGSFAQQGLKQDILAYEEKFIVQDEEMPFDSEQKIDTNLVPGQIRVISQGVNGVKRSVWLLTVIGDQEIKREVVSSQVLNKPVKKIIATNPITVTATRNLALSSELVPKEEFEVESTAYTFTGNNTATGISPRVGIVAVDPRFIPLGTKLYIEGYGYAVAADTGGAIKGKRIDVFLNSIKECVAWGRRRVKVYILPR